MSDLETRRSTNSQRVVYSTAVQVGGRLATSALGIVTIGTITRALSPDAFGQFATATIFIGLLSTFTDAGLGTATVRHLAAGDRAPEDILGPTLLLRVMLALVVVAIGLGASSLIYRGEEHALTRSAILALSATVLIATVQSSISAGLVAVLRHDLIVVGDVVGRGVTLGIVAALRSSLTPTNVVLAYVAGAVANACCDLAFGLGRYRPRIRFDRRYQRELLRVALPLGAAGVLNTVYLRADGLLLSLLRTNADVARYGVAYKVVEFALAIPAFFGAAALPILVRAQGDPERARAIGHRCLVAMGSIAAPVMAGTIALAPELAVLLGGREYRSAGTPLAVLMLGTYFGYFSAVLGAVMIAANLQRKFVPIFVSTLVVNITVNVAAIPLWGTTGAAVAVVAAEAVTLALLHRTCRAADIAPAGWQRQVRPLGCAAAMGAIVMWANRTLDGAIPGTSARVLLLIAIGAVAYGLLGWVTRSLPLAELRSLARREAAAVGA